MSGAKGSSSVASTKESPKKKGAIKKIGSKPDEQKLDLSGVEVGMIVHHNKFGEGTVASLSHDKITIAFEEVYPQIATC